MAAQKIKLSRCPKLDGYAIANFGVRVEREVVGGQVGKWNGLVGQLSVLVW